MTAALAVVLAISSSAATFYVDCDAATGGDGGESSPFNSLADALSASAARDTLAVRGAIEVADPSQRIVIPPEKDGISIVPWGDGRLAIAAGATYAASAGANGTAIFAIAAANATISGVDVTYAKNSLYDKTSKTMARLVEIAYNILVAGDRKQTLFNYTHNMALDRGVIKFHHNTALGFKYFFSGGKPLETTTT